MYTSTARGFIVVKIPKRSNRISRREAAIIINPIRKGFMDLRTGDADTYRGYVVFDDWQGQLTRMDEALLGWVDCWTRFNMGLDLTPHDRLRKKLEAGVLLTYEEIDAALSLLRKQEDMLCRMPKDYVKAQTDTECIVIRMEELGIKVAA